MRFQRSLPLTSLPSLWLVSDARNDARLNAILRRLPRGSGLVFRHYHLDPAARRARFMALGRIARTRGHWLAWAGPAREARKIGAHAAYGDARTLARGPALTRLVTGHSLRELRFVRGDLALLSPVFATRSHPGAKALGPVRFALMARTSRIPVIALGGMTAHRARMLGTGWAAIDGLS